jgi:hypothetical protein
MGYPGVVRTYRDASFDRDLAMRRRNIQLLGLGHPLVDALIRHFQGPQQRGDVAALGGSADVHRQVSARAIVHLDLDNGRRRSQYLNVLVDADGSWIDAPPTFDAERLRSLERELAGESGARDVAAFRQGTETAVSAATARLRSEVESVTNLRSALVALASF